METINKKPKRYRKSAIGFLVLLMVFSYSRLMADDLPTMKTSSKGEKKITASPQSENTREIELEVLEQINQTRHENGLQKLEENAALSQIARRYSRRMNHEDFFAHEDPAGKDMSDRLRDAGVVYRMAAENIFKVYNMDAPAQVMVKGWMDSPSHRQNILQKGFVETGIGVWKDEKTYYATQLFLSPRSP